MWRVHRRRLWLAFGSYWTFFTAATLVQLYLLERRYGGTEPLRVAAVVAFGDVVGWAVLSLAGFSLAWKFPIERGRWIRNGARILVLGFLAVVLRQVLTHAFFSVFLPAYHPTLVEALLRVLPGHVMLFYSFVGVGTALDYVLRYHDRAMEAADLNARLSRAQLRALQAQLQPHFLFNTLNAISALVLRDPDAANRMLFRLSGILRYSLHASETALVTLQEELDVLAEYLEIQALRFGNRLSVENRVDAEARCAMIPPLLLQPLLENAFEHGIPEDATGRVGVSARKDGPWLRVEITDNGRGLSTEGEPGRLGGIGLSNVRARLASLFPGEHELAFENRPTGGLCVRLVLPYS